MLPQVNQTKMYLAIATAVILVIFLGVISFNSGLFVFNANRSNSISADETTTPTNNCFPKAVDPDKGVVGPCGRLRGVVFGYPDGTNTLTRIADAAVTVTSFGASYTTTTDSKGEYDIQALPVLQNKTTPITVDVSASGLTNNDFKETVVIESPSYENLYPVYLAGSPSQ